MNLLRIAVRVALSQPLSERYDYGGDPNPALPSEMDSKPDDSDDPDADSSDSPSTPSLDF